ncbi:hypothetical protein TGAMA5MH_04713 [Trichoderma gamsii]|uniref:Uncharacterized protein n=1 Tax=Trichoderma gamsii TaxID=398673 RepID=A0A2K0TCL0_9HYPO|nr:hypothetical protein TGAMA5MH_04713 [Trichoderma gamsii]
MQLVNLLAAATLAEATTDFQVKTHIYYNTTYDTKSGYDSPRTGSICLSPSTADRLGIKFPTDPYNYHEIIYPHPYVGGYAPIKEDDFNSCFNCYRAQYGGRSIYFRAINTAKDGVDLGRLLFEKLSGGNAAELKRIDAMLSMVDSEFCNLGEQLLNNRLPGVLPTITEGY